MKKLKTVIMAISVASMMSSFAYSAGESKRITIEQTVATATAITQSGEKITAVSQVSRNKALEAQLHLKTVGFRWTQPRGFDGKFIDKNEIGGYRFSLINKDYPHYGRGFEVEGSDFNSIVSRPLVKGQYTIDLMVLDKNLKAMTMAKREEFVVREDNEVIQVDIMSWNVGK